jgi:hypothetical protein
MICPVEVGPLKQSHHDKGESPTIGRAVRTLEPVGPPQLHQIASTGFFPGELKVEFLGCCSRVLHHPQQQPGSNSNDGNTLLPSTELDWGPTFSCASPSIDRPIGFQSCSVRSEVALCTRRV